MNRSRGDAEGDSPLDAPAAQSRSPGNGAAPASTPPKKFDAYHRWLGIPPAEQPPDHYRLLGVPRFEADPDVIQSAADQRMAHLRTVQTGPHGKLSQKLLNEVAAAKVCLLQPDKKAVYDQQLRGELWTRCSSRLVDTRRRGRSADAGEAVVEPVGDVRKPVPSPVEEAAPSAVASPIPVIPSPVPAQGPPPLPLRRRRRSSVGMAIALVGAGVLVVAGLLVWGNSRSANSLGKPAAATSRGHEGSKPRAKEEVKNPPATPAKPEAATATGPASRLEPPKTPGETTLAEAAIQPQIEPVPTPPGFDSPVFTPPAAEKPAAKPQAAASGPPPRLPVPPEEVQQQMIGQLNKIHNLDEARTTKEKEDLANRLLAAARDSKGEPNQQYVLLRKAMELAVEVGDATLMLAAAGELGKRYEVDAAGLQETGLRAIAPIATDAERIEALVKASGGVIERAAAEGRLEAALDLASLAHRTCQRPQGRNVRKEAAQRLAWVQELHQLHQQVKQAQATLKADPQDAPANLFLGRWFCLAHNDWQRGLSHQAKAGYAEFRSMAQQDLTSSPTTQATQVKLADAWWALAEQRKGEDHDLAILRAGHWYHQAQQGQVSGLLRLKIEKRLEEVLPIQQAHNAQQQRLRPPGKGAKQGLWSDVL